VPTSVDQSDLMTSTLLLPRIGDRTWILERSKRTSCHKTRHTPIYIYTHFPLSGDFCKATHWSLTHGLFIGYNYSPKAYKIKYGCSITTSPPPVIKCLQIKSKINKTITHNQDTSLIAFKILTKTIYNVTSWGAHHNNSSKLDYNNVRKLIGHYSV